MEWTNPFNKRILFLKKKFDYDNIYFDNEFMVVKEECKASGLLQKNLELCTRIEGRAGAKCRWTNKFLRDLGASRLIIQM